MEMGRLLSSRERYSLSLRSIKTTGSFSRSGPRDSDEFTNGKEHSKGRLLYGIGAVAFLLKLCDQLANFLRPLEIADEQRVGSINDHGLLHA